MSSNIPNYPDKRPLELADFNLLKNIFSILQPIVSEFTFANLYLFRHVHNYCLSYHDNSLLVSGTGYDGTHYILPPLTGERGAVARKLLESGYMLYGVDEAFYNSELDGYGYLLTADRDNDDYVYLRSDLSNLEGNRYHKKKNRINYFSSRHTYLVEAFSEAHSQGAFKLMERWKQARIGIYGHSLDAELSANREAVTLFRQLELAGVVILVDGEVTAFALGESLNSETVVCHFEKADPFMEGVSQLVNREFSRNQPESCIYINREQDLGESGLRAAKSSYHPFGMVRKFRLKTLVNRTLFTRHSEKYQAPDRQ